MRVGRHDAAPAMRPSIYRAGSDRQRFGLGRSRCAINSQRAIGNYGGELSANGRASDRPARFAEAIFFAFRKVPGCFFGGTAFGN
jgi:hypothetical protein